jgi:hypothetical protein
MFTGGGRGARRGSTGVRGPGRGGVATGSGGLAGVLQSAQALVSCPWGWATYHVLSCGVHFVLSLCRYTLKLIGASWLAAAVLLAMGAAWLAMPSSG